VCSGFATRRSGGLEARGRKLAYGDLIGGASQLVPPKDPSLKARGDFRTIGKPLKRLDAADKVNGKAVFGIDATPLGVKFTTPAACPYFGGKVAQVEDAKAKRIPGVRQVLVFDKFVAVVGDPIWAAKQGLATLVIGWDKGPNA
jgi:isoquinoline 1-oxidoreductase beta subunit